MKFQMQSAFLLSIIQGPIGLDGPKGEPGDKGQKGDGGGSGMDVFSTVKVCTLTLNLKKKTMGFKL